MKLCLLTLGTRGDVQPYAVLGRAFRERGHDVILSSGKNFETLASDYELNFMPVEADFQDLIGSEEGKAMMKNPFLARKHFINIVQPMMIDALKKFYSLAKDADCVLFHVKALGDYYADEFPEKMIRANVIPAVQATGEFPNPVFSALSLPAFMNRFTYKLADMGLAMMNKAIKDFRASVGLGAKLPPIPHLPSIYGVSPSFLPKPKDYPADTHFTGFWFSNSPGSLAPDVIEFLSSGKLTLLVTFGSMPFAAKFDLQKAIIDMTRELDINVVVVKGWGFRDVTAFNDINAVKVIDNVPFDKLFPRVNAVIHHGGIGTLAECLRAGVPSLSCPVIFPMGDQHFWGMQAYRKGCSPKPIALKKLTAEILKEKVSELLTSPSLKANTEMMAGQLASEHGLANAVELVEARYR